MKKKTRIILVIFVSIIGILSLGWWSLQTSYGIGVNSVQWLPTQAHNITYIYVPITSTMAEFEIDQQAFEQWCQQKGMTLYTIESQKDFMVPRCLPDLEAIGVIPKPKKESPEWITWFEQGPQRSNKTFKPGDLYFEERWSDGGGYTLGYDVNEGKGYYWYGHH